MLFNCFIMIGILHLCVNFHRYSLSDILTPAARTISVSSSSALTRHPPHEFREISGDVKSPSWRSSTSLRMASGVLSMVPKSERHFVKKNVNKVDDFFGD